MADTMGADLADLGQMGICTVFDFNSPILCR